MSTKNERKVAQAFAPASVANVAVGFDLLGFSLDVAGDTVTVEKTGVPEVHIESITGQGGGPNSSRAANLPIDAEMNTATAGLVQLRRDLKLDFGFKVSIEKGIPFGSGMGGSAASAVAAIFAANALLDQPLPLEKLLAYALTGESKASGAYHADNIAPSLIGGLTLARVRGGNVEAISLPIPKQLYCVLINPSLSVETKSARGILAKDISLRNHVEQSANLAGFIAACYKDDLKLLSRSLTDLIIEPQRAHLIPGFFEAKRDALAAGAIGCSISGAGPSVFALAEGQDAAERVLSQMINAFDSAGVEINGAWSSPLNTRGARLIL